MNKAFFIAVEEGDIKNVTAMINKDPVLLNQKNEKGESPVLAAIYHHHPALAELLKERGATLDLFSASAYGDLGTVQSILEKDRTLVNSYAPDGWTPLLLAVFFGHDATVQYLLRKGADVRLFSTNEERNTALHVACVTRRRHLVSILLDHEADINASSAFGTPLHYAAYLGDVLILETLLALDADVTLKNKDSKTALELAVEKGHAEVMNILRLHAI